jgi:hypothetical protein
MRPLVLILALSAGCSKIIGIDDVQRRDARSAFAQVAYVKASNTDAGDLFGTRVALSADGSTLAVGANLEDSAATGIDNDQLNNSAESAGAVYIFTRSGMTWSQQAYVKASNTGPDDLFGKSIALSADGSTLAVGAYGERSAATGIGGNQTDNSAYAAGAVYVFTRNDTMWSQQAYIKASNTSMFDFFGESVALSGDGSTLAVGASGEDSMATGVNGNQTDNSAPGAGAVYVFTRSSTTWSQQAYIKASNTGEGDAFGKGVALSCDGSTLVVSAPDEASAATGVNGDEADNSAPRAGAVYVLTRSGVAWIQQAYLKASNTETNDRFGTEVALSGDGLTLAVGASGESSAATGVNGNQADNSSSESGAVYVYIRADISGSLWSQQAYLKASNTGDHDSFSSVSLSADGSMLAVGGPTEDSAGIGLDATQADNSALDSGAVYLFTRGGTTWNQRSYVKASNTSPVQFFGSSVALSGDGLSLAVGAPGESSATTGVDGNQGDRSASSAGAVYVFH